MCRTSNASVVLGIFRTQDQHFTVFQLTQPLAYQVELLGCSLFFTHSLSLSLFLSLSAKPNLFPSFHKCTGYSYCTYTSYNDVDFLLVLCLQTSLWFKKGVFQLFQGFGHGGPRRAMRPIFGGRHYTRNSLKSILPDQIMPLTWKLKIGRLK